MAPVRQVWLANLQVLLALAAFVGAAATPSGPPTEAASSIAFVDNSTTTGSLLGNVVIQPGTLTADPFEYRVFFATTGSGPSPHAVPLPMGGPLVKVPTPSLSASKVPLTAPLQGTCLSNASNASSPLMPCSTPLSLPAGATHLLVRSHNQFPGVLASTSRWTKLVDRTGAVPATPAALPFKVMFTDTDQEPGLIGGIVDITVAVPEPRDIASYRVYFHGKDGIEEPMLRGGRSAWVAEVPATGYNTQAMLPRNTLRPGKATRILVVAANQDGQALEGRMTAIYDQGYDSDDWSPVHLPVIIVVASLAGLFIIALIAMILRRRCGSKNSG